MAQAPETTIHVKLEDSPELVKSLGDLRMRLDALARKVEKLEALDGRVQEVERRQNILIRQRSDMIHRDAFGILEDKVNAHLHRRMTGSIQGLEGVFTVTPPPEWEA